MSHGTEGIIKGYDKKPVDLKDIFDKFKTCEALVDKPKMFFIQACRGSKYEIIIGNPFVVLDSHSNKQNKKPIKHTQVMASY